MEATYDDLISKMREVAIDGEVPVPQAADKVLVELTPHPAVAHALMRFGLAQKFNGILDRERGEDPPPPADETDVADADEPGRTSRSGKLQPRPTQRDHMLRYGWLQKKFAGSDGIQRPLASFSVNDWAYHGEIARNKELGWAKVARLFETGLEKLREHGVERTRDLPPQALAELNVHAAAVLKERHS